MHFPTIFKFPLTPPPTDPVNQRKCERLSAVFQEIPSLQDFLTDTHSAKAVSKHVTLERSGIQIQWEFSSDSLLASQLTFHLLGRKNRQAYLDVIVAFDSNKNQWVPRWFSIREGSIRNLIREAFPSW